MVKVLNKDTSRKNVVLVRPRNTYNFYNYIPLGLICIGSALEESGYNVTILDAGRDSDFSSKLENEVPNSLFVGIGFMTSEIPHTIEVLTRVREISPNTPTVVGGWHASLFPEQMAESDLVDWVVVQEGENPIVKIADAIASGRKVLSDGKILPREIHKMDDLPFPNYKISQIYEDYITSYLTDTLSSYVEHPIRWLPYDSSRGCPHQCTFCIDVVTDNSRYRKKSAGKVIEEIDKLVRDYNLTHLKIIDDNFFVDIKRVRSILNGIVEKGLNDRITIDAECRTDYFNKGHVNDETLALMKKARVIQLTLGIESGSNNTLRLMKKGATVEQAEHAVRQCDKYQIIARSSFILESPGESKEDIEETVMFVNRMRTYPYFSAGVGTFRPYPKCEMTESIIKDGYLKEPTSFLEWANPANIQMYTSSEMQRPWQVAPEFSERASHYLNMESETRIGLHQLDNEQGRDMLKVLIEIAKVRNRNMDYSDGIDLEIYKKFTSEHYQKQSRADAGSKYPLPDIC